MKGGRDVRGKPVTVWDDLRVLMDGDRMRKFGKLYEERQDELERDAERQRAVRLGESGG